MIDTHSPATDDLTVMAAGCGHCMLVISAGAPIRSLELSIPDSNRYCGHLSAYCVTAKTNTGRLFCIKSTRFTSEEKDMIEGINT